MTSLEPSDQQSSNAGQALSARMAKGGGIAFLGQGITRVLSLALQLVLTNFLGAKAYGLYSMVVNLLDWMQQISLLGLNVGVVRFTAPYAAKGTKDRLQGILASAWIVCLFSSCAVGCFVFLFSHTLAESLFKEPMISKHLRWASLCVPLLASFVLVQAFMRGLQRIGTVALMSIMRGAASLGLSLFALWAGLNLGGAIGAFVIGGCAALGFGVRGLKNLGISPVRGSFSSARELLFYSLPILLAIVSELIVARLDVILLGYLRDPQEAGVYRASVSVASMVNFILGSMNIAFGPMISELHYLGKKLEMVSLYKRTTRWVMSVAVFVCCLILALSKEVMGFFGKEFQEGYFALSIISIGQLCNAATGSVSIVLQMTGLQKFLLINNILSAFLNLSLNLILIPKLGLIASAIAAGVSLVFVNGIACMELWAMRKIHPWDKRSLLILGLGGGLLALGGIAKLFLNSFLLVGVIMGLVYTVVVIKIALDREDKDLIKSFFKSMASRVK